MLNEAVFVLESQLASREDIDAAMTLGTNQPLGPLALADMIGLDTVLAIAESLHTELGDAADGGICCDQVTLRLTPRPSLPDSSS